MSMALASPRPEQSSLSGMTTGAVAFALMTASDTIFKLLAEHHPAYQIILVNAFFAMVPVLAWGSLTGGIRARLRTIHPARHLIRGGISVMSTFAAIYAYSRLSLTDYYAIVFAAPLIVTAISALWLGETVERPRWMAIVAGFLGILIVVYPFEDGTRGLETTAGKIAAFISIFCYSTSVMMIRRMRLGETNLAFTFYGYTASIMICAPLLFIHGGTPLDASDLAHLALSGTVAGVAAICLITAYHRTPVSLIAPFQYTQIIWGALASYVFWAQLPSARLVIGAAVVAGCGLFVIYQEIRAKDAT